MFHKQSLSWFFVASLTAACGSAEPELPPLETVPEAPQCAPATGTYAAVFTLRETEGECADAKEESHDPLEFSSDGTFLSPADGLIECRTAQAGCQLAVRCVSDLMDTARAGLDAELSEDGESIRGTGTVEGSYKGCRRVVYDVVAIRKTAAAQ